jgi:hypothetical protein
MQSGRGAFAATDALARHDRGITARSLLSDNHRQASWVARLLSEATDRFAREKRHLVH